MVDKIIYENLYRKLKTIQENIDSVNYNLDCFCDVIDDSFKVNNDKSDKNSIINIKNNLATRKTTIRKNVIPEINKKIM